MKQWFKRIAGLLLASLIAVGFYLALQTDPILIDSASVIRGPMTVTIDEEGVTRVRDVYRLSAPIAGHIGRTALEPGDRVIAGLSVVASIHPLDPPFLDRRAEAELDAAAAAGRFAIELAEAERERAQSAKDLAQADYKRAATLSASSSISQSAFERAHSELQLATAQLKSSEATVRLREAELASTEAKLIQPRTNEGGFASGTTCCVDILAPIDGVILSMVTRSEQAVSTGTLIAELGNPDDLEIRVDLLSSDAVRVNVGSRVSFSDWGGEQILTGTVSRIEPAAFTHVSALGIEEQRVNLIMQIDDVPKGLGHGFRVFARITVWEADDIVQVPISALFRHEGHWSVFTHDDQTASRQSISIGHMNATHAQVLDGLNDDDHVILYPSDLIENNVSIELRSLAI